MGSPSSLPLLFLPAQSPGEECAWRARGLDYSLCISGSQVRVRHAGRELAWEYAGREGPLVAVPEGEPAARINEFLGADRIHWKTSQPAYNAIRVPALYPGVDLLIMSREGRVKVDYVLAPQADPAVIQRRFPGARRLWVGGGGGLSIETPDGDWHEEAPYVFQPGEPDRPVQGRVAVAANGTAGFELGLYDPAFPVVIDPVLSFSTLLGGTGASSLEAVATGPAGEIIAAGFTDSSTFPAVHPQRTFAGGVEAVIVRLAPGGASILQATFLGGSGDDRAFAVAVDPAGGIYVAGWTASSNFPVVNAWRTTLSGHRDAFLARLAPAGDALTFSTFLGGGGEEQASALAADAAGVWVAGDTNSADFPLLAALRPSSAGAQDGFLARFTTAGTAISSTYLGGNGSDTIRALALSPAGEIYAAGGTTSTDLPVPAGGWRPQPGGGQDGFVLRVNAAASAVTGGTYLGGAAGGTGAAEQVRSLALTPAGGVVAGGSTPSADFPVLHPWTGVHRGSSMGFAVLLSADLSSAAWSTFLGGMSSDHVQAVAVDGTGRVFAAGRTFSPDLPLATPLQPGYGGEGDAFLHVLSPDGGTLVFGTYLGGQASDAAGALALTPEGDAVVAGISSSLDFPVAGPLASPTQPAPRFFITLIDTAFHAPEPVSVAPASSYGQQQSFEVLVRDADGSADVRSVLVLIHSSFSSSGACYISAEPGPNLLSLASDSGLEWAAATAGGTSIPANSQCQLRASGSGFALSGAELRLTLDLAFDPSFAGTRQVFVLATDQGLRSSSWVQLGVHTVPAGGSPVPPVAAAIHPAAASGLRHVFSLTVTDANGGGDIKEGQILVNNVLSGSQGCQVRFSVSPPQVHLASDAGSAWTTAAIGSATVLQNAQCLVHAAGSGAASGPSAAVFWADIEFRSSWTGSRRVWGAATDLADLEVPWTELASFLVRSSANSPPTLESVLLPGAGGGVFTFEAADQDGASDLRDLHLMIGEPPVAGNACLIVFDAARSAVRLHPGQDGAAWPSVTPGQAGAAENPRCRLRGEGSSISLSQNRAEIRVQVEFKSGFSGPQPVRAHVLDAAGAQSPQFRLLGWHGIQ